MRNNKFKIVDLFAGAGGMSLGFEQQGNFESIAFVENNLNACKTYKLNNKRNSELIEENDITTLNFPKFKEKVGEVDVVIGGPPCQGFSNANRQKNSLISLNNILVKKYIKAVLKINPKIFVMENVPMLASNVHKFFKVNNENTDGLKVSIENIIIFENNPDGDQIKDFLNSDQISTYYFSEKILASLKLLRRYKTQEEKQSKYFVKNKHKVVEYLTNYKNIIEQEAVIGKIISKTINKVIDSYYTSKITDAEALDRLIEFAKALVLMKELKQNNIQFKLETKKDKEVTATVETYTVVDYIKKMFKGDYLTDSMVLNAAEFGVPQERKRFIMIGIRKDLKTKIVFPKGLFKNNPRTVFDAIADLQDTPPLKDVKMQPIRRAILCDDKKSFLYYLQSKQKKIYNHVNTDTRKAAMDRFEKIKAGQNFHDLDKSLKENTYSNSERTQNTIYLRLEYNKPCGTVVNIRKSMWIHPIKNRAISIREAARLQSFPDSFIFEGSKDSQYQQIGNAVPPLLARAIAEQIYKTLSAEILGKTHRDTHTPKQCRRN